MVPVAARPRDLLVSSLYIVDQTVRASIPEGLKAQATWTLLWTRENILQRNLRGQLKPIDSTCVFHTDRACSNMLNSKPLLIHAMAIRKIRYCSKCCIMPGTIFRIQVANAPPIGPRGNQYTNQRQPPVWTTSGYPGRSVEPEGTTVQSHMATGSSIPEVRTIVFGTNHTIIEENFPGSGFAAE